MLLTSSIRAALESKPLVGGFGQSESDIAPLLRNAQSHSIRLLYGAAAMAGALFVVMVVFIVYYRDDVPTLTGLSAVFGTSIAGLITLIVRMSKSVTQAGILLAMVSQLPDEDALEAMRALLRADSGAPASASAVAAPKTH